MELGIAGLALTGFALFAEFMRNPCVDAGLIPPLVQLLNCKDQEVLLQTGRALGNICYDSRECWHLLYFVLALVEGKGVFWCSVHCVLRGHFPLFLVFIYPTVFLNGLKKWTSHLHNAFVIEKLKHDFNIVLQLDIRIERYSDPGFGFLGFFSKHSELGFQGPDATYAEALNS